MPNREEMVKVIYEKIADKTLSFGCKIMPNFCTQKVRRAHIVGHYGGGNYRVMQRIDTSTNEKEYQQDFGHIDFQDYEKDSFNIIGHPVYIGDCIKWVFDNINRGLYSYETNGIFKEGRVEKLMREWDYDKINKPIEYQSDECIEYIYDLITK